MSLLPWDDMLRAGLRMGLAPQQIWQLSLKEWRALTGPGAHGAETGPMGRKRLEELISDWPDGERK